MLCAFVLQLLPGLVSAIDAQTGVPDSLNLWDRCRIPSGANRVQSRTWLVSRMKPMARRGDLQRRADRLDPLCYVLAQVLPMSLVRTQMMEMRHAGGSATDC